MPISPYVARLREKVGHDLLLLPSVAVLPWDNDGRLLLVRDAGTGRWQTVGGSVEVDESPDDAARREALEGTGLEVALGDVIGVVGGPGFRMEHENGDQVAYVSIVYEATVVDGTPGPTDGEVTEAAWIGLDELDGLDLTSFTQAMFARLGLAS